MNNEQVSIKVENLKTWAKACFLQSGAKDEMAEVMAETLIQGDLLGFTTHGVRRLPYNVKRLVKQDVNADAEIEILSQRAAVETWDAHTLPGIYVVPRAVEHACHMARNAGTGTIVVRRADHVAALAAYLEIATKRGLMVSIMASTPAQQSVAAFGGKSKVFSPNPFAIGVPTSTQPLLLDMSFSMTAAGKVNQAHDRGVDLPFNALIDQEGRATNRPEVYLQENGALLPIGGIDHGYKGYGLCLMSEIWTMALSNYGRMYASEDGERNSVFVQVMDPSAFGELDVFKDVADDLIRRCRESEPVDQNQPVRVPGEKAQALREEQLKSGVKIDALVWEKLESCSKRLGINMPEMIKR